MRWMNPEPITQSEVNQKEKDKYHILMHIYGIDVLINLFARQQWRNIENRLILGEGRRG